MRSHAMPWKQSSAACEQKMFIEAWVKREETVAQLCRRFEISRKTGYKHITRFREWGYDGLGDLSRAPCTHPNATSPSQRAEMGGVHVWGEVQGEQHIQRAPEAGMFTNGSEESSREG